MSILRALSPLHRKSSQQHAAEPHTGKGIAIRQQIRRTLTGLRIDVRAVTAREYAMIASLSSQESTVFSTVSSAL